VSRLFPELLVAGVVEFPQLRHVFDAQWGCFAWILLCARRLAVGALACSLFGVARFGCGALLFPDTLLWVTIFGFCQGWKEYLDKTQKS
jgi:hypothetical protein